MVAMAPQSVDSVEDIYEDHRQRKIALIRALTEGNTSLKFTFKYKI